MYAVHATFQFGAGRQGQFLGKRQRFREEGLWVVDPPEHFTEGKFLTWSEELPMRFRGPDSPDKGDLDFHLKVVQHHLTAVRNGLLLARKLKRILVLPRFTCFCDRHWTPIMPQCAMANSDLKPPFYCPLDHIFNPVTFFRGAARLEVDVREMGFLDDPRVPAAVKRDVARVKVGDFFVPAPDADGNLVLPGRESAGQRVSGSASQRDPPGRESAARSGVNGPDAEVGRDWTDVEIVERLAPLEGRAVIMLSDMAGAMCGLGDEEENKKAERVMYKGDRGADPARGGVLNGFNWCCWNPLMVRPRRVSLLSLSAVNIHHRFFWDTKELFLYPRRESWVRCDQHHTSVPYLLFLQFFSNFVRLQARVRSTSTLWSLRWYDDIQKAY